MNALRALLRGIVTLVLREPVYTQAFVVALIATGTAFGLGWNGIQVGAVSALSAAALAVLTRQTVTPLAAPVVPAGTDVTVTTPGPTADRTVSV